VSRVRAAANLQYAWCGGLVMLPLYGGAALLSWALTGDFGARNVFERRAGLADGGYSAIRRTIRRPGSASQNWARASMTAGSVTTTSRASRSLAAC
jgi:hypothetical protein